MSCYLTQQKYEERQKMVQLSMLLKLLKNRVLWLCWILLKIKCCPSPVYKEERVQKGTLHIAIGQDDDLLTQNSHYLIVCKIQKKCTDVIIEQRHFLF